MMPTGRQRLATRILPTDPCSTAVVTGVCTAEADPSAPSACFLGLPAPATRSGCSPTLRFPHCLYPFLLCLTQCRNLLPLHTLRVVWAMGRGMSITVKGQRTVRPTVGVSQHRKAITCRACSMRLYPHSAHRNLLPAHPQVRPRSNHPFLDRACRVPLRSGRLTPLSLRCVAE